MKYNLPVGYLRGFVVALVVLHHVVLAYHPYAPPPPASLIPQPHWWQAFPVVDPRRWGGATIIAGFNDIFFMSLLFFLSGLFVWPGLERKGAARFLRDRLLRLGLPFAVAAAVIAPLAYYPTYLQIANHDGVAGFWRQWVALDSWPAGPAWFIWVLFVFDALAVQLFRFAPRWGGALACFRPAALFLLLVSVSAAVYMPMATIFNPGQWSAWGPFTFQTSRILHYFAYFLIGAGFGVAGVEREMMARRWWLWALRALLAFAIASIVAVAYLTAHPQSRAWAAATNLGFVLSCAASAMAFLALFERFVRGPSRWFDSLSVNSYGIYLVHYAVVSWILFALAPLAWPAALKAGVAFTASLGVSWAVVAALRRLPGVARIV